MKVSRSELGKNTVRELSDPEENEFLAVGLGFPDGDTEFLVVDPETNKECPLGKVTVKNKCK